jgi:RNA polymerase sigma-70 factor (ECF subfamily)
MSALFGWVPLIESLRQALAITDSTAARYTLADPDVRLMLMVRDDDARAFEELMLRYQNRVVSLLAHMTGQPDLAEDLAQDVFLRVYRARKRYVPGAKFSTWLFTIAGNVAANAQRSRSRRHEVHLPPSTNDSASMPIDSLAVAASGLMPTRQLDNAEMRDAVQQAIGALGERQRMAVLLSKFEHMSYAEIAEVMEMSPEAVKSLLSRARTRLKEVLEPYFSRGTRVESGVPEAADSGSSPLALDS